MTGTPSFRDSRRRRARGALSVDLLVGLAIFTLAVLPLGVSFAREMQLVRAAYWRALAMEIVDGELEVLAAGEGRAIADGQSAYVVRAPTVTNLPPGRFQFTKSGNRLRLEWQPERRQGVGAVVREATLR